MFTNKIKISNGAIVCEEAKLRGHISIGSNTIIHPCAVVNAEAGPIIIGDHCLIEEQAKIIHRLPFDKVNSSDETPELKIGSHNVFEVDCTVEASSVGDNNVFESKCYVGPNVSVPNGCVIGAGCNITNVILKDKTIIFGKDHLQREGLDRPDPQILQMDTLAKVLPNYHRYLKPNKKV